jgi:membrane protease YdiL (CAAX protease family)
MAENHSALEPIRAEMINMFDDNTPSHPDQGASSQQPEAEREQGTIPSASEPFAYAAAVPSSASPSQQLALPEDLRISWGWVHFAIFAFFAPISFFVVQMILVLHYAPREHLPPKELQQYFLNKPQFLFGANILSYALIFLFLYMTLSVLPGLPFWSSLGWKKLKAHISTGAVSPWTYFFSGCGLAVFVAIVSSRIHAPEDLPIQQLFKSRDSALLLMSMAVLIAPLVEETVFRGYLYPLFAKSFGVVPGIVITGILFGLLHGAQLAWTWSIVSLLILVGIVLTIVRARTGTVFASFLLHLGYNSVIALTTIIATHGFTRLPSSH